MSEILSDSKNSNIELTNNLGLTLSGAAAKVKHTGATSMTISSTSGNVVLAADTGSLTLKSADTTNGVSIATDASVPVNVGYSGNTTTVNSDLKISGGLITPLGTALTDTASTDLSHSTQGGKTCVLAVALSQESTYNLPTPTVAGQTFNIVYAHTATAANNIILRTKTTDNSVTIKGVIQFHDTDETGQTSSVVNVGGTTNAETITCATVQALDLKFIALSTTVWYVTGCVFSNTAPSIGT